MQVLVGPKQPNIWVLKVGSKTLLDGSDDLFTGFAEQSHHLVKAGIIPVWVTSGAIAFGAASTGFTFPLTQREKLVLYSVGQPQVMRRFFSALDGVELLTAQLLVTKENFEDATAKANILDTLFALAQMKVIPVVNENDVVAHQELRFRDNDWLAAALAVCLQAERLVYLIDADGVFDPLAVEGTESILAKITDLSDEFLERFNNSGGSAFGAGGMQSKLEAVRYALANFALSCHLVPAKVRNVLELLQRGTPVGTEISARLFERKNAVGQ